MSSVKINIESCEVPNVTPLPRPFISVIRSFIKIQNNVGDNESPCLKPLVVSNHSVLTSFKRTRESGLEYRALTALYILPSILYCKSVTAGRILVHPFCKSIKHEKVGTFEAIRFLTREVRVNMW